MTKLDERQQLQLAVLAAADQRWRDAKRTVETDVRLEIRTRTKHLLESRNDAALIALESRVPTVHIAHSGLATKSTIAAREAIAEARERRRLREEAQPPRFARGERLGEVVVRLHGAELDAASRATGWTADDAIQRGLTSAVFRVVTAGPQSVAVAATESLVDGRPHPVVAWGRSHSVEISDHYLKEIQ